MIERDPMRVSRCGIHMLGPDGVGRSGCPACRSMLDLARTEPLLRPMQITGHAERRSVSRANHSKSSPGSGVALGSFSLPSRSKYA